MSLLLHRIPGADPFQERLARASLDWVVSSEAAARSLAENYVGLPFDWGQPGAAPEVSLGTFGD
jgi:p-hydroxybenzoate 3-monooxygenase